MLTAAPRGQIPHVVACLRLEQRERDIRAAAAAELTAAGVTVVDDEPTYYASTRPRDIASLRNPDTPAGEGMTPEQHQDCPGHVAHVEVMIYEPDPDDDQDDDGQDAAGEAVEVRITYGCTDPEQYGHQGRYGDLTPSRTPRDGGPVPADEDDQARAEREARQAQEKRDARRQLIQRNKDADAATQVRLAFLRECLTVKSRHKAMTAWALLQILQRNRSFGRWIGEWGAPPVLGEILGCDRRGRDQHRGHGPGGAAPDHGLGLRGGRHGGRVPPGRAPAGQHRPRRVPAAPRRHRLRPVRRRTTRSSTTPRRRTARDTDDADDAMTTALPPTTRPRR